MRRRHEIVRPIPPPQDQLKLPKVRRQVERICESIGVDFADLAELRIQPDLIVVITYAKDADGEYTFSDTGDPVTRFDSISVDTDTRLGDERDM